jgi:hypothetical protein
LGSAHRKKTGCCGKASGGTRGFFRQNYPRSAAPFPFLTHPRTTLSIYTRPPLTSSYPRKIYLPHRTPSIPNRPVSLRRERRGDGRLLLELIIVGVRRGADRRLGTRLPQELAPDLTRRPEPPQARTGPRPPSALYLLSLPPPLGVVGRCRSIRWALRRGGILECGNGSIRFIYSWGSLRKFFWGGSRLLTGGVRGGSFFVGVDLSARWFS